MGQYADAGDREFLFVLGSTRAGGNTELLARAAAEHLPAGARQRWLRLDELDLPAFADIRHEGTGAYPEPTGDLALLLDATLAATDLVIASPLYWYSVSASVKLYLDHWSGWMRVPGLNFLDRMRGRTLWAVTASSAEGPEAVAPLLGTLRLTADYAEMAWGGELLGNGSRPGDVLGHREALAAAETFFSRVPVPVAV